MDMKRLILILCIGCMVHSVWAQKPARVPAYPGPIERVQPDGDTIIVRLYGDERRHYMTTEDQYIVVENNKGYICYARQKANGNIVATCKVAHNEEKRSTCEKKYLKRHGLLRKNIKK